jgi:fatty acid desaturase/cytochrome b involved in lipid metabolism
VAPRQYRVQRQPHPQQLAAARMLLAAGLIAGSAACWQALFCAVAPLCPNPTWRAKTLSTLYALIVVPLALRRLLMNLNGGHGTAGEEPSELVWALFGLAAGYYLWALAMTVADRGVAGNPCVSGPHATPRMVVVLCSARRPPLILVLTLHARTCCRLAAFHHLCCFMCYGGSMCDPVHTLPYVCNAGQIFLLSEMSTIFANLRWFAYLSIVPHESGSPQPVEPPDSPGNPREEHWPAESDEEALAARKAHRLLSLARMFEMLFLWSFLFSRLAVGVPTSVIWWLRDAPQLSMPAVAVYATVGVLWHLMNFFWMTKALICPRGRLAEKAGMDAEGKQTSATVKLAMSIGANPCTDEMACEVSVTDALDAKVEIWFRESKESITRISASARFIQEFGAHTSADDQLDAKTHTKPEVNKPVVQPLKLEAESVLAAAPSAPRLDTAYVSYIHGVWYDFTEFKHPGGPVALSLALHRDATALFEAHHPFTSRSKLRAVLRKYEVAPGSERERALEQSGLLAENGPDPYTWDHADVTGRVPESNEVDQFEIELKETARRYFVGEAKRRGVSFQQATKATPRRWCEVAMLAAAYAATVPGMLRGEWWALVISPFMAWVWLANMYHDACHFSLSTRWWINATLPYFTPWLSSPLTWYHQHVVGHHAYPNIGRKDPDLAHAPQLLRHHESIRWRSTHKGQESTSRTMFIWVVATFGMQVLSDARMLSQGIYNKVVPMQRISKLRLLAHAVGRVFFFLVTFVWPFVVFVCWREAGERDWRRAVLFSFVPQMIFSLLFMACSQVNHLTPNTTHGASKNYFRHQIQTAQDFMVHSPLAFWLSGGLNMQIEHHLFPCVCHCHLRALQPMVASLCKKHGVGYHTAPNWLVAYRQHCQHTKEMSEDPDRSKDDHGHHDDDDHDPYEGVDPTGYVWGGLAALGAAALLC